MHLSPLLVLLVWIPFGAYLFRRYPVRVAILANFLGGWAVLPGAPHTPSSDDFPFWILGVCLPSANFLTKATVTGLAALAGILLFQSKELRTFRPGLRDLPMAIWCCVPLLSAAAHGSTLRQGLFGVAYQTLAWGVPWMLARFWFSDRDSLLLAAKGCVAAGLCYIPICLVEICTGPQLYALCYGYQPYRWVGAVRYVGFRPIGFLEDGNQLGIWMAAATLIAVSLSVHRLAPRILGLPVGWVAVGLASTTLLCQSAGSIFLLVLLLPLTMLKQRSVLRGSVAVLVLAILAFALFRMTDLVSLRELAQRNHAVHSIANDLASVGRQSLGWRLARDEGHIATALQTPILGTGQWNWWRNGDARPWSLWLLIFGMYGLVGLLAFGAILFLPIINAVWWSAKGHNEDDSSLRLALVALILMVTFDNLLNGAMILPYLLIMGGLASRPSSPSPTPHKLESDAPFSQEAFMA